MNVFPIDGLPSSFIDLGTGPSSRKIYICLPPCSPRSSTSRQTSISMYASLISNPHDVMLNAAPFAKKPNPQSPNTWPGEDCQNRQTPPSYTKYTWFINTRWRDQSSDYITIQSRRRGYQFENHPRITAYGVWGCWQKERETFDRLCFALPSRGWHG